MDPELAQTPAGKFIIDDDAAIAKRMGFDDVVAGSEILLAAWDRGSSRISLSPEVLNPEITSDSAFTQWTLGSEGTSTDMLDVDNHLDQSVPRRASGDILDIDNHNSVPSFQDANDNTREVREPLKLEQRVKFMDDADEIFLQISEDRTRQRSASAPLAGTPDLNEKRGPAIKSAKATSSSSIINRTTTMRNQAESLSIEEQNEAEIWNDIVTSLRLMLGANFLLWLFGGFPVLLLYYIFDETDESSVTHTDVYFLSAILGLFVLAELAKHFMWYLGKKVYIEYDTKNTKKHRQILRPTLADETGCCGITLDLDQLSTDSIRYKVLSNFKFFNWKTAATVSLLTALLPWIPTILSENKPKRTIDSIIHLLNSVQTLLYANYLGMEFNEVLARIEFSAIVVMDGKETLQKGGIKRPGLVGFYRWHCEKLYFPLNYLQIHLEKSAVSFIVLDIALGLFVLFAVLIFDFRDMRDYPWVLTFTYIFVIMTAAVLIVLWKCIELEKSVDNVVKILTDQTVHPLKNKYAQTRRLTADENTKSPRIKEDHVVLPDELLDTNLFISILMFWNNRSHAPKVLGLKFGKTLFLRLAVLLFSNTVVFLLKEQV